MTPLLPALCSVTFRAEAPEAIVARAAGAGLVAIEWGADVHVPAGDLERARAVRELTQAQGLAVASYGSYLRPASDAPDAGEKVLATARALGAPNIRVWAGPHGRDSADYAPAERDAVAAALRALAGQAAEAGVAISLEYHRRTLTDDLDSARQLLADAVHPNLYTYWQPRPGLALANALEEVAALAPDLSHLHVFAWDADARRYPLADHRAYWRTVLAALEDGRWPGPRYAMLEFVRDDSLAAFQEDAATLRELLAA